ncbi:MAG: ABC transporter ATP-binding protein [Eubacteriales bacterium]|nr:ABC transporter ATP-binding protein [Eubacteriales bacterium]
MKKNNRAWRWLWENSRQSRLFILLLTILSVVYSLLQLSFVTASKNVIDIATKIIPGSLIKASFELVILLLIQLALQIGVNFINVHAASRFEISLKRTVFRRMMDKEYLSVARYHSGELLNRLNSDINVIVNGIIGIIPSAALFITSIVGGFVMLWSIDTTLALIILAIGPLVGIGARLYSAQYKKLHKQCQSADGDTKSFMLEILQNILVVKSFCGEETVLDHAEMLQKRSYHLKVVRVLVSIVANVGMFIIFNAGYYFALAYGAHKLALGVIGYGDLTAILQLVNKIQAPFKSVSSLIPQAFAVVASTERLLEIEDLPDEQNTGDVIPDDLYDRLNEIVFDNVLFKYSDDSVVSGVNMRIKKGECVVVAGESGAGKSTSIKLLLGILQPESGRIYLDGGDRHYIVGRNTRNIFSYVPQGNMILSGTIRENIAFARPDATEEEIIQAAQVAQIWDFIKTLDNGLDTIIGEKGLGLSEGQAQRVSIARALLYNAPVLLLDESTSALDSVTEIALLNAIRKMTDKTCIIVSHKQAAFDICDNVCYVTKEKVNGKI